jgi:AsmA protein
VASIRTDKTRLAKFDLGSKMKILEQVAGIPAKSSTDIELLTSDVRSTPEGTTVSGLKLVVPGIGEMTGQGTISPQHALDFKMLATLATSGTVKAMLGQNIPFMIQGTSSDPSFKADLKGVAGQKIQQAIKNPEGAAKTVDGIINMFKHAPKADQNK